MKDLEIDDFDILVPPEDKGGGGGGGGGGEDSPPNVKPFDEDDRKDPPEGGEGGEGGGGEGPEGDGDGGVVKGTTGEEHRRGDVEVVDIDRGIGGILSDKEARDFCEAAGVPYKKSNVSEEQVKERIRKYIDEKQPGHDGAGNESDNRLRNALAGLVAPQVDWKSVLKRFIGSLTRVRYQEKMPHRKFADDFIYTQRKVQKRGDMKSAAFAVDVSGSMGCDEIKDILTEIKGVVEARRIRKSTIIYFHSEIDTIIKFDSPQAVKKYTGSTVGTGGTLFNPPLDYINDMYEKGQLELAVFLTDGGYADSALREAPRWANLMIWVIIDNPAWKAPWGNKVVHIKSR